MLKSQDVFVPVRGLEADILAAQDYTSGKLWFATDTHKIFYGNGSELVLMSGGNTGIYYAEFDVADEVDMTIAKEQLNDIFADYATYPMANDLIVRVSAEGSCLYRVTGYDENGGLLIYRLMMSGSGDSESSSKVRGRLSVNANGETELLNGELCSFTVTTTSATENGQAIDEGSEDMTLTITYTAKGETEPYYTDTLKVGHEQTFNYEASHLRQSTATTLLFTLTGSPGNAFIGGGQATRNVTTYNMNISWIDNQFANHNYFTDKVPVWVQATGGSSRILDVYFDDYLVYCSDLDGSKTQVSVDITSNSIIYNYLTREPTTATLGARGYSHGRHTVKAQLSLKKTDGSRGSGTTLITKEVGLYLQEGQPLIWFGDMQDTYYEYDTPIVPIRAYDPNAGTNMNIYLYIDSANVSGDDGRVVDKTSTAYEYWELTDLKAGQTTVYQVVVGSGNAQAMERVPSFEVLEDQRHMGIASGAIVNFDARGRSNSESVKKRSVLEIRDSKAVFSDFNWYNNGWIMDDDKITCLRISNGASVSFPIGPMSFAGQSNPSHTIELKLKISNIQNYDKLITSYTRYKVKSSGVTSGVNTGWTDDEVFEKFKAQSVYSNYDAYLVYILPILRETDATIPTYDDLEFNSLTREYNLNNAVLKYLGETSGAGICLGAQDGYFTNDTNSVAIDFVEDEILNMTIVFDYGDGTAQGNNQLMKFYLNGMLTSVARSTVSDKWTIDTNNLIISSNNCDIDLYKLRIYNSALSLTQILQNVAYDNTDVTAWDLSLLSKADNSIKEPSQFSYNLMLNYNEEHPLEPIMPYIIFTTDDSDPQSKGNLPWKKAIKVKADMEFVNTGLDAAYASGDLSAVAAKAGATVQDYYKHHCPSWKGEGVELSVQGTSSEFYPRRNYKAKAKKVMKMNRGPYEQSEPVDLDQFCYDNNTVGCNKFTLKVDYMESSGSYNMGLANLVNYAYSHHPLQDYGEKGALAAIDKDNSTLAVATEYKAGVTYSYYNHKGNIKAADGTEDNLTAITSAEQFNKGPMTLYQELMVSNPTLYTKLKVSSTDNNWYEYIPAYKSTTVDNLEDYRTSVQGFPTLAFWQTKSMKENNEEPIFIGRYNMLLDKGADEAYGFKVDGIKAGYVDNTDLENVAECWEFENNSRGFCSFRDPWNRKTLTFAAPNGVANQYTASNAPIIADYFEYRYNALDDAIDSLVELDSLMASTVDVQEGVQATLGMSNMSYNDCRNKLLELYSHWEEAVAWVWSTATDAKIDVNGVLTDVPSMNTYVEIDGLAEALYETNKYYIEKNKLATGDFDEKTYYYTDSLCTKYIKLTNDSSLIYEKNKYYTTNEASGDGIYLLADGEFDSGETYYVATLNSNIDDFWKLELPVEYDGITYEYDTKEYRITKFKKEIEQYFNLEYLVTYFIITEVLECYDSRGKNCMMASWGPQTAGGHYIWYPIFYDMDTQLGINNTGIPSFEYNIDATDDGCFSTNDSVLWNNLYSAFFNLIKEKYRQLKGTPSDNFGGSLTVAPFSSVELVEKIYNCDPSFTNSYSMRGERPLIALNLDEQYKYITITTNPTMAGISDEDSSRVGYLGSGDTPSIEIDTSDTYFYALQGNRSMSREQFLVNRLNYIDSWLAVGNYERNGANRIRSRISANNKTDTSDQYLESGEDTYWVDKEYGTKRHMFDGEYWITMTPVRDMYVTVGTDAANFPSEKYTGAPVRFKTADLETGVRTSNNFAEQLYYIYGLDQMKSLGDLSKLYFKEFVINGKADKLIDLRLGYDGLSDDENNRTYKNSNVNKWTIIGTNGLPLIQEINLCNIQFNESAGNVTYDLSSSPKLKNFRDTGSNITEVKFAPGVALDTLYLSDTTTGLALTEARLLTNMIDEYQAPELQNDGTLKANKGLYIAGLTDWVSGDATPKLTRLYLEGGNLGYYSYKLLNKYYEACKDNTRARQIAMKDVQWSPYVLVSDTELAMDTSGNYYYDNGHYGLEPFTEQNTKTEWLQYLNNNQLYEYDESLLLNGEHIKSTELLANLLANSVFVKYGDDVGTHPNITGYIYIDNDEAVDEGTIYNELSVNYPDLHFFFKNVNKGYVARFVLQDQTLDDDGNVIITETLIGNERINAADYSEDKYFTSPLERTETEFQASEISRQRPSQDYLGWSTASDESGLVVSNDSIWVTLLGNEAINTWDTLKLTQDVYNYVFYAVFRDHKWDVSFKTVAWDGKSTTSAVALKTGESIDYKQVHGKQLYAPDVILKNPYEDNLGLYERVRFIGYTATPKGGSKGNNIFASENDAVLVDLTKITITSDCEYYAAWVLEDVRMIMTDDSYFTFHETSITIDNIVYNGYQIEPSSANPPIGKVSIPAQHEGKDIISIAGFGSAALNYVVAPYVTHIFFEENHPLKYVASYAFALCKRLKYFDFANVPTLYEIAHFAFMQIDNLVENYGLGSSVKYIGMAAFNGAFGKKSDTSAIFIIPSSLVAIGQRGLMYQNFSTGSVIYQIGSADNRSNLSLSESVNKYFNTYAYAQLTPSGNLLESESMFAIGQGSMNRLKSIQVYHSSLDNTTDIDTRQTFAQNGVSISLSWADFFGLNADNHFGEPTDGNRINWL